MPDWEDGMAMRALPDLEYACPDGVPLYLDLYLPEVHAAPLPTILWVHGGAWLRGTRKDLFPALGEEWTARGYAVASVEYRLSHQATFPAQIHDCKAAVRFLRAHATEYGLDRRRIGAWGSSAGGHLVALLGTSAGVEDLEGEELGYPDYSSTVQAVCDYYGPADFSTMGREGRLDHLAPDSPESLLIGGPVLEHPERVARANPVTYIDGDEPPFFIAHGDADDTVPYRQSALLFERLQRVGCDVALVTVEGAGHGGPGFDDPALVTRVAEFFSRHLRSDRERE